MMSYLFQSQIEYDCPAILGEKRNWQQSFYAQDKIPLDRKYILDLGCGTGYWTKRLNDIIGQTIGIDMSEDFINKAREKYPEIEFKKMDFHHLEFSDNSFDCVYADNVLEHSPYPQKVLSEIYRVLFNKGFFIALIPPDARNPQFSGFDHTWKTDKDEIEIRLQEIGFSNIQIEDINIVKKFKMSPYKASKNSMLFIIAWKWKGGYEAKERCKDIMNFVYNKLKNIFDDFHYDFPFLSIIPLSKIPRFALAVLILISRFLLLSEVGNLGFSVNSSLLKRST